MNRSAGRDAISAQRSLRAPDADLFRKACKFGPEGLVSKHAERACSAGRCKHWIKVKNPAHPGYSRVQDRF